MSGTDFYIVAPPGPQKSNASSFNASKVVFARQSRQQHGSNRPNDYDTNMGVAKYKHKCQQSDWVRADQGRRTWTEESF
jgi:hypothetical protein